MIKKTRTRKVALIVFVSLILIFFSANFIISIILKNVVNKSDSLHVNHVSVNIFNGNIELGEVLLTQMRVDSAQQLDGFIKNVNAAHFNIFEYLKSRQINIQLIEVDHSRLTFSASNNNKPPKEKNSTSLDVVIDSISFKNCIIQYVSDSNLSAFVYLQKIETGKLKFPAKEYQTFRMPSACLAKVDSIIVSDISKMYTLGFYDLAFNTSDSDITLSKIIIHPHYNKSTFAERAKYQTDRFAGTISSITFHCASIDSLLNNKLIAGSLDLQSFDVVVYRDKNTARKQNDFKKTVQEYVHEMKFPLHIDTLTVSKGQLKYQEKAEGSNTVGEISFSGIEGKITGLNTTTDNDTLHLKATSVFMESSRLRIDLDFPLAQNYFDCSGQINDLPLIQLNEISGPNGGILFSKGAIKKLAFNMRAGAESSAGDLLLEYENLDFAIKNKQNGDTTGVKSKLMSFIVGELIIPSSNPNSAGQLKPGHISYTRDKERFIFNYIWKSIYSGITSLILENGEKVKKKRNRKNKN